MFTQKIKYKTVFNPPSRPFTSFFFFFSFPFFILFHQCLTFSYYNLYHRENSTSFTVSEHAHIASSPRSALPHPNNVKVFFIYFFLQSLPNSPFLATPPSCNHSKNSASHPVLHITNMYTYYQRNFFELHSRLMMSSTNIRAFCFMI